MSVKSETSFFSDICSLIRLSGFYVVNKVAGVAGLIFEKKFKFFIFGHSLVQVQGQPGLQALPSLQ